MTSRDPRCRRIVVELIVMELITENCVTNALRLTGVRQRAQNVVAYRNLLRGGFLVGWFNLVGFKVLVGRIPFLRNQFFESPKFRWSFSH